ncbi:MAG TPA: DegT/DnrJ/EryC1/StrS family aminotransferase [Candidatus Sulfotelmatobacter sp.]|nr:DegT/DnrJ/EryC1/StrS family aminotransferase [Candidatus Sulfotelmatobacter sp.]
MRSSASRVPEAASLEPALKNTVVPFLDLKAQFALIREEVVAAITRVMESQQLILGPEVAALEQEIAEATQCRFAIGCASGSDALLLALMACGVGPGDEVVTTPFTFVATAGSIARLGARPVFVDIDSATYNLDPGGVEAAITPRTRAILPVHLFGLPADMDSISEVARRHNLPVIEDAAQAIGARYRDKPAGSMGQAGCFSFFPSKNLGGAGDGGMIVTNDPSMADRLRLLRQHGSRKKYRYEILGINSRLDALQAAILRVKLKHLPAWALARQHHADRYRALFAELGLQEAIGLPAAPEGFVHAYNQFVIRTKYRDELRSALRQQGIPTEIYYPSPLHLQPAFANLRYSRGDFPVAEEACAEVLALPVYPELTEHQQRLVVRNIEAFLHAAGSVRRSNHAAD